ncbi:MAG TPA: YdcF family protein [Acidimicrobiales bacterium]|nr:YdcF family protein [Acidimicrobiales bacterium]
MIFGIWRVALKIVAALVVAVVLYVVVTGVQVWLTSRLYEPRHAGAIVVMGAAQYNGVPSPDLRARLNEALSLYKAGFARLVVVTGYKEKADHYTEAETGARYLETAGVPAHQVLQVGGSDSYENLADADRDLKARDIRTILIATDAFHEDRSMAIASGLGLKPWPTPTKTSPITGWSVIPYFAKEALDVSFGRIVGYHTLSRWHVGVG